LTFVAAEADRVFQGLSGPAGPIRSKWGYMDKATSFRSRTKTLASGSKDNTMRLWAVK
jgi:hypothetical protein